MRSRRLAPALLQSGPALRAADASFPGLALHEPESARGVVLSGSAATLIHGLVLATLVAYTWSARVAEDEFIPVRILPEPRLEAAPKVLAERSARTFAPVQSLTQKLLESRASDVAPPVPNQALEMKAVEPVAAPAEIRRRRIDPSRTLAVDEIAAARTAVMELANFDVPSFADVEAPTPLDQVPLPRVVATAAWARAPETPVDVGSVSTLREGVVTGRDVIGVAEGTPLAPDIQTQVAGKYLRGSGESGAGAGSPFGTSCTERPAVRAYVQGLRSRVYERWTVPEGASTDDEVMLRFTLDAAGSTTRVELLSSANPAMGASALAAFRSSSPFPPVPDGARCLVAQPYTATFRIPGAIH